MSKPFQFRLVATKDGPAAFVVGDKGLSRSYLPGPKESDLRHRIQDEFPDAAEKKSLWPAFAADLKRFFRGQDVSFDVDLDMAGVTEFQAKTYRALRRVRAGKTLSYGQLAARAGRDGAARAVGTAMSRNPFPPVVP